VLERSKKECVWDGIEVNNLKIQEEKVVVVVYLGGGDLREESVALQIK
jgi:hypothetical protein